MREGVHSTCIGRAASAASLILAGGAEGSRNILTHGGVMIHHRTSAVCRDKPRTSRSMPRRSSGCGNWPMRSWPGIRSGHREDPTGHRSQPLAHGRRGGRIRFARYDSRSAHDPAGADRLIITWLTTHHLRRIWVGIPLINAHRARPPDRRRHPDTDPGCQLQCAIGRSHRTGRAQRRRQDDFDADPHRIDRSG